jgi:hypothetical protein
MRKRTAALAAGGAVVAAVALGGAAVAANGARAGLGEGDENVTGAQADRAKAAALAATHGGRVDEVEREDEAGAAWKVEVTTANGDTVKVRLDGSYHVVATETDHESATDNDHESPAQEAAEDAAEGGSDADD